MCFVSFYVLALHDIFSSSNGMLVACNINCTVTIKIFSKTDFQNCILLPFGFYSYPSRKILTHVVYFHTNRRDNHLLWLEDFVDFNCWHPMGNQTGFWFVENGNWLPCRIVITRFGPSLMIQIRIVQFTIVHTIISYRTGCPGPGLICIYNLGSSVEISYVDLCDCFFTSKPLHPVIVPPFFIRIVPSVAKVNSECIHTLFQQVRNIIGVVKNRFVIGRSVSYTHLTLPTKRIV